MQNSPLQTFVKYKKYPATRQTKQPLVTSSLLTLIQLEGEGHQNTSKILGALGEFKTIPKLFKIKGTTLKSSYAGAHVKEYYLPLSHDPQEQRDDI